MLTMIVYTLTHVATKITNITDNIQQSKAADPPTDKSADLPADEISQTTADFSSVKN